MKRLGDLELLVPAGNMEKLKVGLQYGADAFYMGMPSFSMRSRINNFDEKSIMEGVRLIRKSGKKFYVTINIYPRGNKVDAFKKHLKFLNDKMKPDGVILADPGVLEMVKEYAPKLPIHMSVQANVLNYRAVKFWQKQGATRIILPRELMLSEIKEIHEKCPDMELEFFVHGAICVAYSGRCLLSAYMTGRDANQGICAHNCRWNYKVREGHEYALEEEERPGEFYPIEEDSHGTYIMNSKDMCLLPYLKDLVDAGICSFKVEGRNKTEYYLATVTKAYRQAIDDMMSRKKFDKKLLAEVAKTGNRGFIPGFLFGFPGNKNVEFDKSAPQQTYKVVGILKGAVNSKKFAKSDDFYEVEIRNRLEKGWIVEIMTPDKQFEMKLLDMFDLQGEAVELVHGGAGNKILKLRKGLPENSILRIKC
ncbi:MAG: U32 family peptidase C-terminal domain-containing protein [Candidatus Gracilibacteria bacterium]|nr:U32 family peptidase C-terminal domain-containing protein [Candidatus Gracilibacteria bacterium]